VGAEAAFGGGLRLLGLFKIGLPSAIIVRNCARSCLRLQKGSHPRFLSCQWRNPLWASIWRMLLLPQVFLLLDKAIPLLLNEGNNLRQLLGPRCLLELRVTVEFPLWPQSSAPHAAAPLRACPRPAAPSAEHSSTSFGTVHHVLTHQIDQRGLLALCHCDQIASPPLNTAKLKILQ
jgi:hypothetical protein